MTKGSEVGSVQLKYIKVSIWAVACFILVGNKTIYC